MVLGKGKRGPKKLGANQVLDISQDILDEVDDEDVDLIN